MQYRSDIFLILYFFHVEEIFERYEEVMFYPLKPSLRRPAYKNIATVLVNYDLNLIFIHW